MPQVFKIGKRERTVHTVLFLSTFRCIKPLKNTNYIHCNVCSWQKSVLFCIAMYEVLAKSKHAVISMLFL